MNSNQKITLTWQPDLPTIQVDKLKSFTDSLSTEEYSFVDKVGDGIYSYDATNKLIEFLATDDIYKESLIDMRSENADVDTINSFICKIDNFNIDPTETINYAVDNNLWHPIINNIPYWEDFYYYMTDQKHRIPHPDVFIPKIEKVINENPDAWELVTTQIKVSIEQFGYYKDERDIMRIILHTIDPSYEETLKSMLPKCILDLNPRFGYQSMQSGTFVQIHRDHDKVTTLWWLMSEPIVETRFYLLHPKGWRTRYRRKFGSTTPGEAVEQFSKVLELGNWYLFNHAATHSVHLIDPTVRGLRAAFTVNFDKVSQPELAKILKDNGYNLSNI